MNFGDNIQNAFDFAKRMTEDAGRWIILIILSVIPIVNFVTIGYASKVIKESPASRRPPKLERYVELWVQGLKVIGALIIYMIIPLIIFGFGSVAFFGALMSAWLFGMGSGQTAWAAWPMAGLAGIAIIIGVIVTFLIAIIAVMGIAHMVKKNQFGKAFAFKEITDIIGRIGWGNYILWLIVLFVINLIYGAIGRIPWIGWIITLILIPPYLVFISRSVGLTYSEYAWSKSLTDSKQAESVNGAAKPETKICPKCGRDTSSKYSYCSKCGSELQPMPTMPEQRASPSNVINCPCGRKLPPETLYCDKCGRRFEK